MLWTQTILFGSCLTAAMSFNVNLQQHNTNLLHLSLQLIALSPLVRTQYIDSILTSLHRRTGHDQQQQQELPDVNSLWNRALKSPQPQPQPLPEFQSQAKSANAIAFPKSDANSTRSSAEITNRNSGQPGTYLSNNVMEKFHTSLFQQIAPAQTERNIIYSPLSLHTLLAFLYTGATGQTAQELQTALHLGPSIDETAKLFRNSVNPLHNLGEAKLVMANKMYYSMGLRTNEQINTAARTFFNAEIEAINFNTPVPAALQINNWVEEKTQGHIKDIVQPQTLKEVASAILVNAIYFKARWAQEFSTSDTQLQQFYMSRDHYVAVDMMYNEETFRYGEFADLQAKVIELPYKDSELSMLIILPNEVNGLAAVEQRLGGVNLATIAAKLMPELVTLRLPKFRIEFDANMLQPLKNLGINKLFGNHAELTGFFGPDQAVSVSDVQHKAFIEVNEAGSEAAASSYAKLIPLSLPPKQIYFTADHPFMFAIRSPEAVYFVGHVAKL